MSSSEHPALLRLRGEIDSVGVTFDLQEGEHRIGSSPSSDLHLAVEGVSRQHAVLWVTADSLVVEDRGSKNGTFVNQGRVERAGVPLGATLAFGPAELLVQAVDVEDTELALTLELDPGEPAGRGPHFSRETATLQAGAESSAAEAWLWLVEGFAERLFATSRGDVNGALSYLIETLGATAGCLVEWLEDKPLVLSTSGPFGQLSPRRRRADRRGRSFQIDGSAVRAALSGAENPPLELWIWGDFEGRSASRVLMWTLLRLLDRTRNWTTQGVADTAAVEQTRVSHPQVVFPEDYQPGVSPAMTALYRQVRAFAHRDLPVLIVGETGVGKERLAEILHLSSERLERPFLALNCAAIPSDLLEAELFGIGKGVATGVAGRTGKIQQAEGGTLFLDEIGEMDPALQAKLLRALQDKQIQPVGQSPRKVDVRIVAATNADLDRRMAEGTFRSDLYYRLAGLELAMPPLRDCPEDTPHLIEHFLSAFAQESGVRVRGITVKAFRRLLAHPWPGNVRELRHEIRRLVYLCSDGDVIDVGKLSPRFAVQRSEPGSMELADVETLELGPRVHDLERRFISEALRRTNGRQARAAQLLGMSRNGLADKVKRLGIEPWAFRRKKSRTGQASG